MQTDRAITNNKQDIVIWNNENATCMLIDVAVSGDRNVIKKEAEKSLKIEIQRMWNVKTKVIPVIIGATGTISKSIHKIPQQHTVKARRQGTTDNSDIGHCTLTAGSTDVKYRTFVMGNSITCSINCNYRIAATLYTVETWFVSGV